MRQILESPSQLIHTTSRYIKVSYPFSQPLLDYIREMIKVTTFKLNQPTPVFKLSDEYPKCVIHGCVVKMPHIVVKYRIA